MSGKMRYLCALLATIISGSMLAAAFGATPPPPDPLVHEIGEQLDSLRPFEGSWTGQVISAGQNIVVDLLIERKGDQALFISYKIHIPKDYSVSPDATAVGQEYLASHPGFVFGYSPTLKTFAGYPLGFSAQFMRPGARDRFRLYEVKTPVAVDLDRDLNELRLTRVSITRSLSETWVMKSDGYAALSLTIAGACTWSRCFDGLRMKRAEP